MTKPEDMSEAERENLEKQLIAACMELAEAISRVEFLRRQLGIEHPYMNEEKGE